MRRPVRPARLPARPAPTRTRRSTRSNRSLWDRAARTYERRHAPSLRGRHAAAWGVWRIPEQRLRLLGRVRGSRTLELGCGAADWSIALARRGARPVGIDFSAVRVRQAASNRQACGVRFPLAQANAERLPFHDAAFDLVFCDWGAMTFADPAATVPEVARVLADQGRFVFATASPIHRLAYARTRDRLSRSFQRAYFGMHRLKMGGAEEYQLPYGTWIGLFRRHHLRVEALVETRPSPRATSTYWTAADRAWSRRWPAESIWSLSRETRKTDGVKSSGRLRSGRPRGSAK